MAVNKVILIGNVGKDPEIRTMNNGNEGALFSLATSEYWKDKNTGEKKDKTEWHRIVAYSQGLVNVIKNYVKKGTKLYVSGSIQTRSWVDTQGIDRHITEIILQGFNCELQILDPKPSNNNSNNNFEEEYYNSLGKESNSNNNSHNIDNTEGDFIEEIIDDDIPF